MAQQSALQIVRTVCGRVGINKPNTATGSTDMQVQQLIELLNEEGQELAARFDWQILLREKLFTTVAGEDQGPLVGGTILAASDGFRKIVNNTIHNRTTQFPVTGPLSPQMWQAVKATTTIASPYAQYRIRGGRLYLYPGASLGNTCAFEYLTANWVQDSTGDTFRDSFTQDEDLPLFDSQLLTKGLLWRWKAAKGLEYAEDFNKYEAAVLDAMTGDKTADSVRMDGSEPKGIQPVVTVARGSWNL
jgi:hypothetical protein